MDVTNHDTESDSRPSLREIESLNLFSQGNIYTTKIIRRPEGQSSAKQKNGGTSSILVGTLKPPKLLNINLVDVEQNIQSELAKDQGN